MDDELERRRRREEIAKQQTLRDQKAISYIDDDGCEVTVTSQGHIFYNATDWY